MTSSRERWAMLGISAQFLALIRVLAQYFWLRHTLDGHFTPLAYRPFIFGALIDAVLCFVAVLLFFWKRYTCALIVSVTTIVVLLAYKIRALGWG
jgi:hypothetical protein